MVPPESTAQAEELPPMETDAVPVNPETATGVVAQGSVPTSQPPSDAVAMQQASGPVVEPFPSSPNSLSPQHSTVPSESSAHADSPPKEMAMTE
jgi:hypothetical protein